MNLSELRTRVRRLTGIRDTDYLSDAEVDATVNEVYRELAGADDWPFLMRTHEVATVAGTAEYALPATFRRFTSANIVGSERRALDQRPAIELDALDTVDDDEPEWFAQVADASGQRILLWPTPDAVYTVTLRGYVEVDDLSAGTSPVWSEEFHPLIAYGAAARLLAEEGDDSGRAERYEAELRDALGRMMQRYTSVMDRRSFVMGGRGVRRSRRLAAY